MSKLRTAGDGMESEEHVEENTQNNKVKLPVKCNSKATLLPGRLVQIYPSKFVTPEKKSSHIYSKTPKFVPYEPYPGAVKPLTPTLASKNKKSKNHMDINKLVSQMSQMDTNIHEFKPRNKLTSYGDKSEAETVNQHNVDKEMQNKIDELTKENESLKEQLKQQAQV